MFNDSKYARQTSGSVQMYHDDQFRAKSKINDFTLAT